MNLFFRLIYVIVTSLLRKTNAPLYGPTCLDYRVWLTDQDMFAHMTNSRYLSFSDLGTINYMVRSGFAKILREKGWVPVINAQSLVIKRMLKTPQKFQIQTRLMGWTDTYIGLQHTFVRNGQIHAEVYVLGRLTARDRSKPAPAELAAAWGVTEPPPDLTEPFIKLIEVADSLYRKQVSDLSPAIGE